MDDCKLYSVNMKEINKLKEYDEFFLMKFKIQVKIYILGKKLY